MIKTKQKYQNYKNSNAKWLKEKPSTWDTVKLKYLFDFEKGKNAGRYTQSFIQQNKGEYPVYSGQTEKEGVMGKIDTYDYDFDRVIFTTTVGAKVMTPMILEGKFNLSQNCLIMIKKKDIDVRYFYYQLSPLFRFEKRMIPSHMQPSLRVSDLNQFDVLLPPKKEQQKIANYLDEKTSKVDKLIEKNNKLIELLKEKRQAVITKAVTKGIDEDVEMKDSGVDWIGEIPEEWEITRLRFLANINTGSMNTEDNEKDGKYRFYVRSPKIRSISNYSYDEEAVLTSGDGAGVCEIYHYVNGKYELHQRMYRITDFKRIEGKYLYYYMKANFKKDVMKYSAKSTVDSLRMYMFKDFPVVYASKKEQKKIVEFIQKQEEKFDSIIEKINVQNQKLKEYKKTLISKVVTGKIKV